MMLITAAIGAAMATIWLGHQASTPTATADARDLVRVRECTISLVLVSSDGSPVSHTIDRASGGRGFSHAYLDPCRMFEDGRRAIIDFLPAFGVHWSDATKYMARPHATIRLEGELGEQIFGCVRSKLGEPFNVAAIFLGRDTAANCTGLIVHCLPWALRKRLGGPGRCVAPNDLARFFNVKPGDTVAYRGGA